MEREDLRDSDRSSQIEDCLCQILARMKLPQAERHFNENHEPVNIQPELHRQKVLNVENSCPASQVNGQYFSGT
jgi:hypothetical protein